jgi:Fe2+ or Zn2+ uptake regulation protein
MNKHPLFSFSSKSDLKSIHLSFLAEYQHLKLLNLFNKEKLFVCDIHSRFALYHAFFNELNKHNDEITIEILTSKFLMNTLNISFPSSYKILSNLSNLGFLTKHGSKTDKRVYEYKITPLGISGIMLWESFRVNDLHELNKLQQHDDGFLNMTPKRLRAIRKNWLGVK